MVCPLLMPARKDRGKGLFQPEMIRILSRMGKEVKDNRRQELLVSGREAQKSIISHERDSLVEPGTCSLSGRLGSPEIPGRPKKNRPPFPGFLDPSGTPAGADPGEMGKDGKRLLIDHRLQAAPNRPRSMRAGRPGHLSRPWAVGRLSCFESEIISG